MWIYLPRVKRREDACIFLLCVVWIALLSCSLPFFFPQCKIRVLICRVWGEKKIFYYVCPFFYGNLIAINEICCEILLHALSVLGSLIIGLEWFDWCEDFIICFWHSFLSMIYTWWFSNFLWVWHLYTIFLLYLIFI